jgi:hypothetical protein
MAPLRNISRRLPESLVLDSPSVSELARRPVEECEMLFTCDGRMAVYPHKRHMLSPTLCLAFPRTETTGVGTDHTTLDYSGKTGTYPRPKEYIKSHIYVRMLRGSPPAPREGCDLTADRREAVRVSNWRFSFFSVMELGSVRTYVSPCMYVCS